MIREKLLAAATEMANKFSAVEKISEFSTGAAMVFRELTCAARVLVYLKKVDYNCVVVMADTLDESAGSSFLMRSEQLPSHILERRTVFTKAQLSGHPLQDNIDGYIGIPLIYGNESFGLIEIFEPEPAFINEPDLLNLLVLPVSMGLRNIQISEELHQQSEVVNIINRIAKIVSSSLRIDSFYDDFANEVKKLVDFDRISIALADEENRSLKVYAISTNLSTSLGKGVVIPLAGTAPEAVIQHRRPIVVKDLEKEREFVEDEWLLAEGIRSAIRLPLVIKDNVMATLQLNSKKTGLYGERELNILQKVADRIAEAIENTVLFNRTETVNQQLKQQNIRLEALNSVNLAVNESLELENVLHKALDKVLEVTGWDCGDILIWDENEQCLNMLVHQGLSANFVAKWHKQKSNTIAFKTAVTGETIYVPKISDSKEYDYLRQEGIVSAVHIPLYSKQKLVGVMPIGIRRSDSVRPDQELLTAIGNQLGVAVENSRLYRQIRELAEKDSLTGLWNRRKFFEFLELEVTRSQRYNNTFALLMIDVDHFKDFNDTFGHLEGDGVLSSVGRIIQKNVRENDYAARLGGEEFAVIAFESDARGAWELAERIRLQMERERNVRAFPTVSIGLSVYGEDGKSGHDLYLAADAALYAAKKQGRNKTVWRN